MMRSLLAPLLVLLTVQTAQARLSVFACEPEWAALAQTLGGNQVEVFSATTAQQDVHFIQARPSLIARLRSADLLICTGAELEVGWLPMLQRRANNPRVLPGQSGYLEAASAVTLLEVPERLDRAEGDIHAQGNPHIHTDPRNIARVAVVLAQRLAELDPAHREEYAKRYRDFADRWQAALQRWQRQAVPLRGMPIVVQHPSWTYLEHWLGLRRVASLEPKPGIPASSTYLSRVLAELHTQPARMVIRASYQEARPSEWLSQQTGIPAVELPYTVGGNAAAQDLFGLFDDTLQRLLEAAR